jgi:hypothetical protein
VVLLVVFLVALLVALFLAVFAAILATFSMTLILFVNPVIPMASACFYNTTREGHHKPGEQHEHKWESLDRHKLRTFFLS